MTPEEPDWKQLSESVRSWLRSSPEARCSALRLVGWLVNTINEAQQETGASGAAQRTETESESQAKCAAEVATATPTVQQEPLPFVVDGAPLTAEPLATTLFTALSTAPAAVSAASHREPELEPAVAAALINQGRITRSQSVVINALPPAPVRKVPVDLAVLAQRLRTKAKACRLCADRRALGPPTGAINPEHRARFDKLIIEAKSVPNCYLWMLHWQVDLPGEGALRLMAESFDNLAAVIEAARDISAESRFEVTELRALLELLSECQSALRVLVMEKTSVPEDSDQLIAFGWLRDATDASGVYVERYMRLNDPADPEMWAERAQRVQQLNAAVSNRKENARQLDKAWEKLRWHAKRIPDLGADKAREDWSRVYSSVDYLLERGVQPSNADLRQVLLPVIEVRPTDAVPSQGWTLVLEAIDQWLAHEEAVGPPSAAPKEQPAHVLQAAELLQGARVVLVGGDERPESRKALVRDLRLGELEWISSREHSSLEKFTPAIVRPETRLVLLLIRWSSHSYEGISDICAKHNKVFVRIPKGYSPSMIAHHVLENASEQLRAMRPGI